MNSPKTVAVLGAGNRGRECYGRYIRKHPETIQAVAVAEPDEERRSLFADEHDIPPRKQFNGWKELLERDRLADGLIISTLDTMHVEPALKAMDKGYKLLLEKPISTNLEGILKVYRKHRETDGTVLVAHVLRYTHFFQKLKALLEREVIGEVRFVDLIENIGYDHFAHSYVRGNWRNTEVSAPIILAKSCHDLDILHWLLGTRTKVLSSRASREVFHEKNRPPANGFRPPVSAGMLDGFRLKRTSSTRSCSWLLLNFSPELILFFPKRLVYSPETGYWSH